MDEPDRRDVGLVEDEEQARLRHLGRVMPPVVPLDQEQTDDNNERDQADGDEMPSHVSADTLVLRQYEAEYEDELPGERVEEPLAVHRPSWHRNGYCERCAIEGGRKRQHPLRREAVKHGNARRHQHDHDVQWQDVEMAELVGDEDEADMGRHRIVEHSGRVVPLEQ